MSYEITDREFNATLQLNEDYREHQFFIKIIKGLDVYVLKNGEDLLMLNMSSDDEEVADTPTAPEETANQAKDGIPTIPVWCHEKYAAYYAEHATDESFGRGFSAKPVPLAVFLEKWIPQLKANKIELAIFPLNNDEAWNIISAEEFLEKADKAAQAN